MNDVNPSWPRIICGVCCWSLLIASTAFPALHVDGDGEPRRGGNFYGWTLLIFGWMPIDVDDREALRQEARAAAERGQVLPFHPRDRWIWPAWFANLCFLFGTAAMMLRRYRLAIAIGAISVALALTSLFLHNIYCGDLMYYGRVDGYGPGFFLWLSAMGLSLAAPIGLWIISHGPQVHADVSELNAENLRKV
jgi:hypothetical protein